MLPSTSIGLTLLSSILVLKDGQIIERGSHKELLARGGVFAAMWADQILTSGDPIGDQSVTEEAVSGKQIEPEAHAEVEDEAPCEHATSGAFAETPEASPIALVSAENTDAPPVPAEEPVARPADEPGPPAPVTFPTSDDTQLVPSELISSQSGGGITFEDSANLPPSRTATPDPEGESKRKRISSQNFQRLARKMSLATRRQGSGTIIPGIKRETSAPQASQDGAGTSSARNSNDSPAGSVQSDTGKNKDKKKDKKEKRKSIF